MRRPSRCAQGRPSGARRSARRGAVAGGGVGSAPRRRLRGGSGGPIRLADDRSTGHASWLVVAPVARAAGLRSRTSPAAASRAPRAGRTGNVGRRGKGGLGAAGHSLRRHQRCRTGIAIDLFPGMNHSDLDISCHRPVRRKARAYLGLTHGGSRPSSSSPILSAFGRGSSGRCRAGATPPTCGRGSAARAKRMISASSSSSLRSSPSRRRGSARAGRGPRPGRSRGPAPAAPARRRTGRRDAHVEALDLRGDLRELGDA